MNYNRNQIQVAFMVVICFSFWSGCTSWSVEDKSNESIPNYSLPLLNVSIENTMRSDIVALDDNNFIIAIQDTNSNIVIKKIYQEFEVDNWTLNAEDVLNVGQGNLSFFGILTNGYILGYTDKDGVFKLQFIDNNYNIDKESVNLESFIDTFYNQIDSVRFMNFTQVSGTEEIIIGGRVYTEGTNYSCLLNVDVDLNPKWFKTYFENSTIPDLISLNQDRFLLLNSDEDGTDLIRDNRSSDVYLKYNLSHDQIFFGSQAILGNDNIILSGIHNDIGRTIEVNLNTNSSFVNEIEIYPVTDLRTLYLSRNNTAIACIQQKGSDHSLVYSELGVEGSLWCHKYTDEQYVKILDLIELPGKGILISSIVERDGLFFIHLIRIDEEGATFINEYSENCI